MTYLLAGIVLVAAIAAPYLIDVALSAAFPGLRRWTAGVPRRDEVVEQFFYRTIPGAGRTDDLAPSRASSEVDTSNAVRVPPRR